MVYASKDVFYVVLSFCILLLTFFTCWILFYVVSMFRQFNHIFNGVKRKMDAVDEILKTVKEKIEHSASVVLLLVKGIEELVFLLRERKNKGKKEKS